MAKLSVLNVVLILVVIGFCAGAPPATKDAEKAVKEPPKTVEDKKVEGEKPLTPKKKHKETFVEIAYGKEKVAVGNFLEPVQVKDIPVVEWKTEPDTLYTLLMIDIDAPTKSDPVDADYVHWLTGNIPANDMTKATVIVEYLGAFPGNGTGIHNYMFMLYEQPKGRIEFTEKFISKT